MELEMEGSAGLIVCCLALIQSALVLCSTVVERYEVVIYQTKTEKQPTYNSTLTCLHCYNGDVTNDCQTLHNLSNIPRRTCLPGHNFCKVRRVSRNGQLLTFDRHCDSHCRPGCREAAYYSECVSCCQHGPLCNVDNSAFSWSAPRPAVLATSLLAFVSALK